MEVINEQFIKLFALFVGSIGSFTLVSWCKFQIELFFVALKFRREQIKRGFEPRSILSAFGHIKAAYKGSERAIIFKFEEQEDK
jgi:hypothetical protein